MIYVIQASFSDRHTTVTKSLISKGNTFRNSKANLYITHWSKIYIMGNTK